MQIQWSPSPNFRIGRKNRKIIALVDHITAGLMPGTLYWLSSPFAQASAHYLISKSGEIYQMVKDEDTAWHAGVVNKPDWPLYDGTNPNYYTIGIEHEALAGQKLTESQYQATLWLHKNLVEKHSIIVDRNHIIGHYRIDSINRKNDPGAGFPWERLFSDLQTPAPVGDTPVNIQVGEHQIAGIILNGQSYGPVREILEAMGKTVNWDAALNAALIPPVNTKLTPVPAGSVQIAAGSVVMAGILVGGKTFAPIRKLMDALGHELSWDEKSRTVLIK